MFKPLLRIGGKFLKTERCYLCLFSERDYESVKKLYENEHVRKYLGGTVEEEAFKHHFTHMLHAKKGRYWAIFLNDSHAFIGFVFLDSYHDCARTEIGYQLLPQYWRNGYASEVVTRVIEHGFSEWQLQEIVAETQTRNMASCKLLRKVGMTCEGQLKRFGEEQSMFRLINLTAS
ncbi:GNAT family N-acetyltransferase [Guptibacillus hwajinpoensis]|uniref:GNAT family N-acetyltransferase n=1 Tax=Guptibacillus hwajinpoensis TaxID=208199 RepID=UPI0031FE963B